MAQATGQQLLTKHSISAGGAPAVYFQRAEKIK